MRTSPEFAAKKLLAAGETKIFEFARVFRDRERGDLHLPEFTMLEWYRANAGYDAIMADTIVVIAHAAQATGIGNFSFRGKNCDPFAEPELLTVASAFNRFAGIDLLATVRGGEGDRAALAVTAKDRVRIADDDTWLDIFSKVLVEHDQEQPAEQDRHCKACERRHDQRGKSHHREQNAFDQKGLPVRPHDATIALEKSVQARVQ